jgi:hypothetical protein
MSAEWVGEARETRCLMMFFDSHVPKPHQNVKSLTGNRHVYKLFVRLTLAIIGTAICLKKTNLPYGKSPKVSSPLLLFCVISHPATFVAKL